MKKITMSLVAVGFLTAPMIMLSGCDGNTTTDTLNEGEKTYNTTIIEANTTIVPEDKGDVVIVSGANGVYVDEGGVYIICSDEGCGDLLVGSETNDNDSDSSTNDSYNSDDDQDSNDDNSDNSDNSSDDSDNSDNSDNSQDNDTDVNVDINCTVNCEDEDPTATPK